MTEYNTLIEDQYYKHDLFEDILNRLKEQGIDIGNVSRSDIASVDEFHVRGAQVSNEIIKEIDLNNAVVLDVGCGLGGPCRMLADEFNCKVTGIDMSNEFINTAKKLSALIGLTDRTEFIHADALDLPFDDASFDVVWTQHVQMNIHDKSTFYSEISRVLKKTGTFIYYDIFKNGSEDVNYPVPWANNASVSFLGTITEMNSFLNDLGFTKIQTTDQTN